MRDARAAGPAGAVRAVAADGGGAARRGPLPGRLLPDPGRLQGDDGGALGAGARHRPARALAVDPYPRGATRPTGCGAAGLWAVVEVAMKVRRRSRSAARALVRKAALPAVVAVGVLVVAAAPEIG